MKNKHLITESSRAISNLRDCSFYTQDRGVSPLPFSNVKEGKCKNKYIYYTVGNSKEAIDKAQKYINEHIFNTIPTNRSSTAYQKEKSYLDFLEPHRANYFFLRLDIRNFFHSISIESIREALKSHISDEKISENFPQSSIDLIINLSTIELPKDAANKEFAGKRILPIGFKTSPAISNIVFRKIDIIIEDFCAKHSITYTRYADDMLFSFKTPKDHTFKPLIFEPIHKKTPYIHSENFKSQISFILNLEGLKLNNPKTISSNRSISINGYIINGTDQPYTKGYLRISEKKTKLISKMIFECKKETSNISMYRAIFGRNPLKFRFKYKPKIEYIENYCKMSIDNKIGGYYSYLYSLINYDQTYNCLDNNFRIKCDKYCSELAKLLNARL